MSRSGKFSRSVHECPQKEPHHDTRSSGDRQTVSSSLTFLAVTIKLAGRSCNLNSGTKKIHNKRVKANNDTIGRNTGQLPQSTRTTGPELSSPKTRPASDQHPHVAFISLAFHAIQLIHTVRNVTKKTLPLALYWPDGGLR